MATTVIDISDPSSPLCRALRKRIAYYMGGHLDRLMEDSQRADDEVDAIVASGVVPSRAKQMQAEAKFQRFLTALHEYERTCRVLNGEPPNERDLSDAYELAQE